jgi:hypothetical protein
MGLGGRRLRRQDVQCPDNGVDHNKDDGMQIHGSREAPIKVLETRQDKYVAWEYRYIDGQLVLPRRCLQVLIDKEGRRIDRIVMRDACFNHHVFYFDVTEQLDVLRKQLDVAIERMRQNRAGLSPEDRALLDAVDRNRKSMP